MDGKKVRPDGAHLPLGRLVVIRFFFSGVLRQRAAPLAAGAGRRFGARCAGPRRPDRLALRIDLRLRELARTLFVDDDVAALDRRIVEMLERFRPGLARSLAGA